MRARPEKSSNDLPLQAKFCPVGVRFFDRNGMLRRLFSRHRPSACAQLTALLHQSAIFKISFPRDRKGLPRDAREPYILT